MLAAAGDAQVRLRPSFSHSLTIRHGPDSRTHALNAASAFPETLRVLTAMVAFQQDNDSRSSGDGSFDTSSTTRRIVDPPPHDRAYVQEHLTFLQNYFRRASHGKLTVTGDVLGSVYRLPYPMPHYSPPRGSPANAELGLLMQDAWHLVDSVTPGVPFRNYDLFLIVHAGVGRDVDLTAIYGFDPTPFDLPSIYLNLASLRKMFGESYQGVVVAGGADTIRNTILLPETESRDVATSLGTAKLQLGINGLLAASVGSHLGLPDLFDTKTGATGIGRFGLMDGQSIFSWNGLFPPEPSAWERYFLGWTQPVTLTAGNAVYELPAIGGSAGDTVYRVLISEKEYFLVENRNRDANGDGAAVTFVRNAQTVTRTWPRDTVGFNAFDTDSLYGVITDVDEFDWSLPGGVSSTTHEFFDGGILIWHIDEHVIETNYETDAVNANPDRRGVNLEEADGSQDIGQTYGLISAGAGSENGTVLDFWYAGNRAPLRIRSNSFTPSSQPGSGSYDHADSHISVSEFSARGARMTARIQVGDDQISMLPGFPKQTLLGFGRNSLTVASPPGGSPAVILAATLNYGPAPPRSSGSPSSAGITGPSRLFGWRSDGAPVIPNGLPSGELADAGGTSGVFNGKVAFVEFNNDTTAQVAVAGSGSPVAEVRDVYNWNLRDVDGNHVIDTLFTSHLPRSITTSPVISDSFIAVGTQHGMVYLLRHDGSVADSFRVNPFDSSDVVSLSLYLNPSSFLAVTSDGSVEPNGLVCPANQSMLGSGAIKIRPSYAVTAAFSADRGKSIILVSRDGLVSVRTICALPSQQTTGFTVPTGGEIMNAPAVADLDGDGSKDVIVFSGNKLYAINAIGSVLDNFPVTLPTSQTVLCSPIVADIDGDGSPDVVGVTQEGLVVAYDKTGKMLSGFPLLSGANGGSTPAAFYAPGDCLSCTGIGLAVASDDGHVYGWKTGTLHNGLLPPPVQPWPQYLHDGANTGLSDTVLAVHPRSAEFFPASLAYNWPNPVDRNHGYKTHIRYFVKSAASVHIRIFDLAGDLVTEFDGPGAGGLDNEVEWDVTGIQSGIYFARIEAQGTGGSGSALIKIAVVK